MAGITIPRLHFQVHLGQYSQQLSQERLYLGIFSERFLYLSDTDFWNLFVSDEVRDIDVSSWLSYGNVDLFHIFSLFLLIASQTVQNPNMAYLIREKKKVFFLFSHFPGCSHLWAIHGSKDFGKVPDWVITITGNKHTEFTYADGNNICEYINV